jgi:riboflavin synthase
MFTGIIEELGAIEGLAPRSAGARITVRCKKVLEDSELGSSIAVNGVCLTAAELRADAFSADVAPETLRRSNLGALQAGSVVNLERPMTPGGRLGGHMVQGHVDATGEVDGLQELGDGNWWLTIRVPAEIDPYLVEKGSIAIDGISLTIAALEADLLSVTVIPHTFLNTTLSGYGPGSRINLETDIIAKHVAKLLAKTGHAPALTVEKLKDMGY